ncbi:hypothetical protein QE152_g14374 [Popillia japonica]|uniref:Uncharacterized protein n=1 Tax=Popillia japonica TaxID=7064 RepID=A0AAW1L9N2_POPJA
MKRNLFIILYFVKLCLSEESDGNLFPTLPIAPIYSSNELCKEDSTLYVESLNNLTLWAYKMNLYKLLVNLHIHSTTPKKTVHQFSLY